MYPLDKTKWPDGPWKTECDNAAWDLPNGLHALIRRNPLGAWCGYVGVPPTHPWYGRNYTTKAQASKEMLERNVDTNELCVVTLLIASMRGDKMEEGLALNLAIRVHGGLTFADHIQSKHQGKDGWWYFGFDCAHSNDYVPGMAQYPNSEITQMFKALLGNRTEVYRTEEFVRSEVAHLSEELLTVPPPCVPVNYALLPRTSRNQREGRYMDRMKKRALA